MNTATNNTGTGTTREANIATVQRLYQAMDQGDTSVVETYFAPEWVNVDPILPPLSGLEGARTLASLFHNSFPDFDSRIQLVAAEGDRVAVHATHTGTHQNTFMGIPATGKTITVTSTGIFTFKNGKLIENRVIFNAYGLLQQLGVAP